MTVRAKLQLSKDLMHASSITHLWARAKNFNGDLLLQVEHDHKVDVVTLRSSNSKVHQPVDLLLVAPAGAWRKSSSFLSAVKLGYLDVQVVKLEKGEQR